MTGTRHVCQFVNSAGPTSIPADIATGLARHTNVKSTLVSWFETEYFEGQELVETHSLHASDGFIDWGTYTKAKYLVDELGVDVLHTHHNHAGFYAKAIGLRLGVPVVRTEQNTHDGYTRVGRVSNGLTNPLAARVTCISRSVYDSFSWWEKLLVEQADVDVIPNGVDLQRVEGRKDVDWHLKDAFDVDEASLLVGNAAMFTEQKAQDTLIRAVKIADDRMNRDIELVFAGAGDLKELLVALAEEVGIGDRVHFVGLLDRREVYRMMEAMDVFCMPSRWEGFCVAVAEAMAVGTPCILSDIDVFEEIYGDSALYHPVDDADALASALVELGEDEERQKVLSERSRNLVRSEYDLEAIVSQYDRLYSDILAD